VGFVVHGHVNAIPSALACRTQHPPRKELPGNVKRLLILILVLSAAALLIVTSCEPETEDLQIQDAQEAPVETRLPEVETEPEIPESVSLYGAWVYVKSSRDDEVPLTIHEFALFPPSVDINADNRILAVFNESLVEGIIVSTDIYDFTVAEITAITEGHQWFPDDITIKYIPESGLLRYTVGYAGMVIHHYFTRR
jgi:hypothetical protein